RSHTPALRRETVEALVRQPDRVKALLDAIEAGRGKPGDLDPLRSQQLVRHPRAEIPARAGKLLRGRLPADRKKVLARYRAALAIKGDLKRGQVVFQKNCASCHQVAGVGVQVGPDISDTLSRTPEALLTDILDPNAAIDSNYVVYTVSLRNGR